MRRMKKGRQRRIRGEDHIVHFLQRHFGRSASCLKMGIGDDAAVFQPKGADELWVVTTDLLVEDIDFRRGWLTPRQLGHRALAVNLSDLAAMGARPRFYTVALGFQEDPDRKWIGSFYRGLSALGEANGAVLIGGDLSRTRQGLHISIAALGESLHRRVLYRSGGLPGDSLFVTGMLGKAAAGLRLLSMGKTRGVTAPERRALKAQQEPQPRCAAGLWLAQSGLVSCMMDLSDGLSADLPRLCEACGTGAEVYSGQLPIFPRAVNWECDPTELALHGGEDFELLFAVPGRMLETLIRSYPQAYPPITRIGKLTSVSGVMCRAAEGESPMPLPPLGFDHFRK